MHEPRDPVIHRRHHPKKPRTLTGTGTVTSCLHFPGLVTVWACLTHPLWLGFHVSSARSRHSAFQVHLRAARAFEDPSRPPSRLLQGRECQ